MRDSENAITKLHFIIAPRSGFCAKTGFPIVRGVTCLERLSVSGKREWYSAGCVAFKWWVEHHTLLNLEQAQRGLCSHGLLADCEKCRDILPRQKHQPQ